MYDINAFPDASDNSGQNFYLLIKCCTRTLFFGDYFVVLKFLSAYSRMTLVNSAILSFVVMGFKSVSSPSLLISDSRFIYIFNNLVINDL